ncbi:MAG: hypothetical protein KDA44_18685 [Planctomycetales bacterium]|nr:hypothetical protein [Planctomycetales bacterium]
MRTERRHRLATNELAHDLEIGVQKLRPHMTTVVSIVGAALVLFGLFTFWRNSQAQKSQAAWTELQSAMLAPGTELEAVHKVIADEELGGQEAQEWAAVAWADRQLRIAAGEYLVQREAANDRLDGVAGLYKQFAANATNDEVHNRARLGLGRVHEMRNEIDEAKQQYARVQGALAGIADERIKALEHAETAADLAWLAKAEAILPSMPAGGGVPGARPPFSADQPLTDRDGLEFNPNRPLEDILGGFDDGASDSGRYDEPPAGADDAEMPAADDGESAAETDGAEQPAADDAAEPAASVEQ